MQKQSGFTLIELVIVVVILGFLAATAIPKFVDLTEQAKEANVEGMAGGFASAVSLVRAQWEAEGRPSDGTNNYVEYDGTTVYLTTENANRRPGYIIGTDTTSDINSLDCVAVWQSLFQAPPQITDDIDDINGNDGDIYEYYAPAKSGNGANSTCRYYLVASLNKNGDDYDDPGTANIGDNFTYRPANSEVIVYIND